MGEEEEVVRGVGEVVGGQGVAQVTDRAMGRR